MNSIETIDRLNARAILDNVPALQAKGCFVVVEYAGLHVVGCESFSGDGAKERADEKLAEISRRGDSTHGELFTPTGRDVHAGVNDDHLAQRFGISA